MLRHAFLLAPILFAWPILAQPLPPLGSAPATPPVAPRPAPPTWTRLNPPLKVTVGGHTMRVTQAAWCRAEQLPLESEVSIRRAGRVGLALRIETPVPLGRLGTNFVSAAMLYGSSSTLDSSSESKADLAPDARGFIAFWSRANPRWSQAALRLEWRDPNASEEAEGKFERAVTFEAPLPARPDVPLQVEKTWTSPHGGTYTLRKIFIRSRPFQLVQPGASTLKMPAGTYITMQRQEAALVPNSDAYVDASEEAPELFTLDEAGGATPLKSRYGGSSWLMADMADDLDVAISKDTASLEPRLLTHFVDALPPPGARSLRIRFTARERSAAWRDPRALSQFRFRLDLAKVPRPEINAAWKPVALARGKYLEVALDEWSETEYHDKSARRLRAVLWTRDLQRPGDAQRQWILRGDTLSARIWTGNEPLAILRAAQLFESKSERTMQWQWDGGANWRPSYAPVVGSEMRRSFGFTTIDAAKKTPTPDVPTDARAPFGAGMSLAATWDEWLVSEHDWTLADLPIPRPGQVLEINRVLEHDGARVVLRKLGAFDAKRRLAGLDAEMIGGMRLESGMVAVFEVAAEAFPGSKLSPLSGVVGLSLQELRDDQGREIASPQTSREDDTVAQVGKGAAGGREKWTTFFRPPAPDAKNLSLRLLLTEAKKTGRSESLSLPDLPAPGPIEPARR